MESVKSNASAPGQLAIPCDVSPFPSVPTSGQNATSAPGRLGILRHASPSPSLQTTVTSELVSSSESEESHISFDEIVNSGSEDEASQTRDTDDNLTPSEAVELSVEDDSQYRGESDDPDLQESRDKVLTWYLSSGVGNGCWSARKAAVLWFPVSGERKYVFTPKNPTDPRMSQDGLVNIFKAFLATRGITLRIQEVETNDRKERWTSFPTSSYEDCEQVLDAFGNHPDVVLDIVPM